jgi:hypothetical protein
MVPMLLWGPIMKITSAVIPALLMMTGCVVRAPGDEAETGESGASETDPGEPTSAETGILGETGDTEPASSSGTTLAETGEVPELTTGFEDVPAICGEGDDPGLVGDYALDVSAWGLPDDESFEIDVLCTVDAVNVANGQVATVMTCDNAGVPAATTLTIDEAPEGSVAWAAGASVHLIASSEDWGEIGFDEPFVDVQLRTAGDEELLVVGLTGEHLPPPWIAPLVVDTTVVCAPEDTFGESPNRLMIDFGFTGEPGVTIFGGHRGTLDIAEDQVFVIDVPEGGTNNCCHFLRWYEVLIRRVNTG